MEYRSTDRTISNAEPHIRSRAIRAFFNLPNPVTGSADFVSAPGAFYHDQDVLIAGVDASFAMANHYDELTKRVHLAWLPPQIARQILNNAKASELAAKIWCQSSKICLGAGCRGLADLLAWIHISPDSEARRRAATRR